MLQKINKRPFYCERITSMVPSGTINQVTPTGTITCLDTVCFSRRRNQNRVSGVKTHIIMTNPLDSDNRRPDRPGSPTCGDPVAAGAVGRDGDSTYRCKTERGIDPINPINERNFYEQAAIQH